MFVGRRSSLDGMVWDEVTGCNEGKSFLRVATFFTMGSSSIRDTFSGWMRFIDKGW